MISQSIFCPYLGCAVAWTQVMNLRDVQIQPRTVIVEPIEVTYGGVAGFESAPRRVEDCTSDCFLYKELGDIPSSL